MPKIPRPQKARRLNDIFVPQIPRFRRRGGLEFFVGFSGFVFYVIIYLLEATRCFQQRHEGSSGLDKKGQTSRIVKVEAKREIMRYV